MIKVGRSPHHLGTMTLPGRGAPYFWFPGAGNQGVLTTTLTRAFTTSIRVTFDLGPGGIRPGLANGNYCPGGYAAGITAGIFNYVNVSSGAYRLWTFGGAGATSINLQPAAPNVAATASVIRYLRTTLTVGSTNNVVVDYSMNGTTWVNYQTTSAAISAATITGGYCTAGAVPYTLASSPWSGGLRSVVLDIDGSAQASVKASDAADAATWTDPISASTVTLNRAITLLLRSYA